MPSAFEISLVVGCSAAVGACIAVAIARRLRGNRCSTCGYSLRGLESRRCPECGTANDQASISHGPRKRVILKLAGAGFILLSVHTAFLVAERYVPVRNVVTYQGRIVPTAIRFIGSGAAWSRWNTCPEPAQIRFASEDQEISLLRIDSGWAFEESRDKASSAEIAVLLGANELDDSIAALLTLGWANGELDGFARRARTGGSPFVPEIVNVDVVDESTWTLRWVVRLTLALAAVAAVWWILRSERR